MRRRDARKKRRRKKVKPREELERLALERVPILDLFNAIGKAGEMEDVHKLVSMVPTDKLEELVRRYR